MGLGVSPSRKRNVILDICEVGIMKFTKKQKRLYDELNNNYGILWPSGLIMESIDVPYISSFKDGSSTFLSLNEGLDLSISKKRPLTNGAELNTEQMEIIRELYIQKNGNPIYLPPAIN